MNTQPLQWPFCEGRVPELVLLPQFHLLAKHQAPSASLHILPCSIPSKKKEAGAPFYAWDDCVILVMLRVFPFWKDACCQGPTTSKWALCLPASGFWMQPAALWGLPDMLPFSFHRTGGKLSWEDDTVGNRSVALSLERLQICSVSAPKHFLCQFLVDWNLEMSPRTGESQRKTLVWSGQNEVKHTPLQTTLG